ncbi:hypothetical protein [Phyllobacterium myrsinacearum]|uniref:hypothetical protein n=1 Tax=Phyllobacterium myrsinacearum TaxID=28101 RepID=UPI001029A12A|nr:hypothetical protein [Phyllobacterium myrsinacearum]
MRLNGDTAGELRVFINLQEIWLFYIIHYIIFLSGSSVNSEYNEGKMAVLLELSCSKFLYLIPKIIVYFKNIAMDAFDERKVISHHCHQYDRFTDIGLLFYLLFESERVTGYQHSKGGSR